MTRRISQPVIDELLSKTDVVEVIDEFLSLRKTGRNFVALCPF
ncbi:MAG: CHC2 zinc finger domain-containing protein, partial [Gammaproteobacteria bacterium]